MLKHNSITDTRSARCNKILQSSYHFVKQKVVLGYSEREKITLASCIHSLGQMKKFLNVLKMLFSYPIYQQML